MRTAAGYRQYSPADIERLRFVLRQQRDRYMPLKVIGERLAALDAGEEDEPAPRARLATRDGVSEVDRHAVDARRARARGRRRGGVRRGPRRGRACCARTARGRSTRGPARSSSRPRRSPSTASTRGTCGSSATAADRQADLVEQVVAPWRGQRSASSRARAGTLAAEVGELCTQMHTALVRAAVADLAP